MADISKLYGYWDILPHNQILWIWMRTGTLGLLSFWAIICAAILSACKVLRRPMKDDLDLRALAIWAVGVIAMLIVSGLLDLQLSNYRNMIFVGLIIGMVEGLRLQTASDEELGRKPPRRPSLDGAGTG